jgi:hypothetical protein
MGTGSHRHEPACGILVKKTAYLPRQNGFRRHSLALLKRPKHCRRDDDGQRKRCD